MTDFFAPHNDTLWALSAAWAMLFILIVGIPGFFLIRFLKHRH